MNLSVPTPDGWLRQIVARGELLRAPAGALELLVLPIEGAKLAPAKWMYEALVYGGASRPAIEWDARQPIDVVQGQLTTVGAWTAVTVEARVGDEYRLVAYFTFLDLCATVIASSPNAVSEWRDEVIEILYRAGPDFTPDRITCLAELLDAPPPLTREPVEFQPELWRRVSLGGDVALQLRDDPNAGWIRQTQGLTPLRSVPELFAELRDVQPEIGVTDDGEYFAIGSADRGNARRTLAFVFGAGAYTRIEARVFEPARADMVETAVRALAYQATLGCGTGRIRPYYYLPPARWSALVRPGSTLWVSPLCARLYHVLRVFEAHPAATDDIVRRRRFETIADEFQVLPPLNPAVYYRADDREVRVMAYTGRVGGAELRILDATVIDEEYCYPFRIECDPRLYEDSMTLLEEVVKTIIPLPALPQARAAQSAHAVFAEWAE